MVICLILVNHAWATSSNVTPEGRTLAQSPEVVLIAQDGEARAPIVVADDASEAMHETAGELAAMLGRITGGTFAVEVGTASEGIVLGTLEQFPDDELAAPLAIENHYDGVEAFVIRSDDGRVRLLGNTDLGARHAAHRFLELLGCRWYFMTPTWEIVPERPTLSFDLNEDSRPDIWSRRIWFDRLAQRGEPGDPSARDLFDAWSQRNRMDHSLNVHILHIWQRIPIDFPDEFEAHPDYFALVDGERQGPQFCVTNPGLQEVVTRFAHAHFESNPDAHMVSLDPADQPGWCTCDDCAALGHHTAQPFYLANIIGRALQASHPGKYVGLLAYSWYSMPPEFAIEPNVYVQLTRGMNTGPYGFDELFEMWAEKCERLGIYEYYSYWQMDEGKLPGTWVTDLDANADWIRRYRDAGVTSISAQSSNNWGIHGLAYYVANRLMWDASADVDALRHDFLDNAFGPAAPAIARYYERSNAGTKPLAGMNLIRQCIDDLEEAAALASGRPDVLARIDDLRKLIVYSYIGEQITAAADSETKKDLTLDWLTWAYRIRNTHMIPWLTFRSSLGRPASVEFDEPTWFWRNTIQNPEANPWRVDTPVTSGELDEWFVTIKESIGEPIAVPETADFDDYVLVDTGEPSRANRSVIYSVLGTFLVASREGEPIHITIEQRPHRVERPDAQYTLADLDGNVITSGQLPIGEHELTFKVPGPGVYHFSCHSRLSGYQLAMREDTPAAILPERGRRDRQSGLLLPLRFYVPKGTRELLLYAHESGTVRISDSQDRVVYEASSNGRVVRIPVEPGEDGAVWSVGGVSNMRLRSFQFLNIPTAMSWWSTRYVFVPREIAQRDGLVIVSPSEAQGP